MERDLLQAALEGLEMQRERLDAQIADVRRMLGDRASSRDGAGVERAAREERPTVGARKRPRLSAEARTRIAEAQRKRWAAAKGTGASQGVTRTVPAKKAAQAKKAAAKRTMSEEGRQRIIAALKKRWAAVRAQKKAGAKA